MPYTELDWPGVLALAGRFCATERGLSRLLEALPSGEAEEVRERTALTADLMALRERRGPLALGGLDEGARLLPALGATGRALSPDELLDLFLLLERSEAARKSVAATETEPVPEEVLPELRRRLSTLSTFESLLAEREIVFEPSGRIKDTATARLAALRAAIVRIRREVVRRLEEFSRDRAEALSESYVTEKGGRYCLPVRADRRDNVAGIVHEKSRSGQTVFVEPLAVVEANNALAGALEEEREEVHRILVSLTSRFSAQRSDIERAIELLTELDAFQARAEFSRRIEGVFVERGSDLKVVAARHPLLDRLLATLREETFGERPEERTSDAVPLDLELGFGKRLLVVSGPNAGGKSVVMKTIGLLALLSQSGFAVPAKSGTRLPIFDRILVVAGDAQDLLGDLSSFASAMTRTARVLTEATALSLVLLDEIGSGTDPDEGAALAVAILEEDLARGGLSVATTHLSVVKEWGHDRPEVLTAAMEFDEASARPTFRIRPGTTGRSHALGVARKAGIPERVLITAKSRLGSGWVFLDAARERLEREISAANVERERLAELRARLDDAEGELERQRSALLAERAAVRQRGEGELARALEALREKARRELDRIREEARLGKSVAPGALNAVLRVARDESLRHLTEPEDKEEPGRSPALGDRVRVSPFRATGRVVSIDMSRGQVEVDVSGKRMKVAPEDLVVLGLTGSTTSTRPQDQGSRVTGPAREVRAPSTYGEIVLVGLRVDVAIPEVEKAINEALLSGKGAVRIVHGFGTGRLATAVREYVSEHPGVASHRPGDSSEGGNAVTIATLDV